jgi:EmrB/QacA subfamily drug resistance transporter
MSAVVTGAIRPDVSRWVVLAIVIAGMFVFVVDAFVVNVAIPSIQLSLQATAGEMQGVIAIYQIAYATMVITGGRLGDIFGRRRMFILGVLAFAIASLVCGLAQTGEELVLARLLQGIAAAAMVPQVLATIHVLFPDDARNKAFAVYGIALGLGGAAGCFLGGLLLKLDIAGLGWRTVFLVNLPICAMIAFTAWRLVPRSEVRAGVRLDVPGAFVLFCALISLIAPPMFGQQLGWPLWLWDVMAAGLVLLAGFLAIERRVAMPLIDLDLLADGAFGRGLVTIFAFQFGNISFYLLVTLFLQGRLGLSPLYAGSAIVPLALAFTLSSRLTGGWVTRYGVRTLLGGLTMQLISLLALMDVVVIQPPHVLAVVVTVLMVFGFGQGLVMAPLSALVLRTVRPTHAGAGSGILNTVHQAAGATGVSIVGLFAFQGRLLESLILLAASVVVTASLLLLQGRRV